MQLRKATLLSFFHLVTRTSYKSIKQRPSYTIPLLLMAEIGAHRWHSGTAIGQESGLSKIVSALSSGTVPQQNRASSTYRLLVFCSRFEQQWHDFYLARLADAPFL